MLGQRFGHRPNINPALVQRVLPSVDWSGNYGSVTNDVCTGDIYGVTRPNTDQVTHASPHPLHFAGTLKSSLNNRVTIVMRRLEFNPHSAEV